MSGTFSIAAGFGGPAGSVWMQPLLLLAFFGIMYFILIRPAHKRQKTLQSMQDSLTSGARVVTSGGLKGTVVRVEKDSVKLRIAEKVQVDVTRSSIVGREDGEAPSG
ncbi:MAG: preprotein translocase subunit YajC [Acidobacteria bacterium]|nr:preprotein translocase subunit YajC [Acidobacteriota bacterium]